jgi:hypothetical protein
MEFMMTRRLLACQIVRVVVCADRRNMTAGARPLFPTGFNLPLGLVGVVT